MFQTCTHPRRPPNERDDGVTKTKSIKYSTYVINFVQLFSNATDTINNMYDEITHSRPSTTSSGSSSSPLLTPTAFETPSIHPFLRHKAHSSVVLPTFSSDQKQVLIVSKKGKQKYYNLDDVFAHFLEEDFQVGFLFVLRLLSWFVHTWKELTKL